MLGDPIFGVWEPQWCSFRKERISTVPIPLTHMGSLKKMEITVFFDTDGLDWMISVVVSAIVSPRPDFTLIMMYYKKMRVSHEVCRTYSLFTHFTFASFGSHPVWIHPSLILAFIFISTAYLWSFPNASQTVVMLSPRQTDLQGENKTRFTDGACKNVSQKSEPKSK